jgi:hypothetical protein
MIVEIWVILRTLRQKLRMEQAEEVDAESVDDIDMGVTDARQVMSDEQRNAVADWENSLPVFQIARPFRPK